MAKHKATKTTTTRSRIARGCAGIAVGTLLFSGLAAPSAFSTELTEGDTTQEQQVRASEVKVLPYLHADGTVSVHVATEHTEKVIELDSRKSSTYVTPEGDFWVAPQFVLRVDTNEVLVVTEQDYVLEVEREDGTRIERLVKVIPMSSKEGEVHFAVIIFDADFNDYKLLNPGAGEVGEGVHVEPSEDHADEVDDAVDSGAEEDTTTDEDAPRESEAGHDEAPEQDTPAEEAQSDGGSGVEEEVATDEDSQDEAPAQFAVSSTQVTAPVQAESSDVDDANTPRALIGGSEDDVVVDAPASSDREDAANTPRALIGEGEERQVPAEAPAVEAPASDQDEDSAPIEFNAGDYATTDEALLPESLAETGADVSVGFFAAGLAALGGAFVFLRNFMNKKAQRVTN